MIVEFSSNLLEQKIYAEGDEVANLYGGRRLADGESEVLVCTFSNPRLVTDTERIFHLPLVTRETLVSLLGSHRKTGKRHRSITDALD